MIKKLVIAAVFAVSPLAFSSQASADHCGYRNYHRGHRAVAPVVRYRGVSPYHSYYRGIPAYGTPYGAHYGSRYNRAYRSGYGGFGGPYYGRGSSIGVGRGGVSLYFGF